MGWILLQNGLRFFQYQGNVLDWEWRDLWIYTECIKNSNYLLATHQRSSMVVNINQFEIKWCSLKFQIVKLSYCNKAIKSFFLETCFSWKLEKEQTLQDTKLVCDIMVYNYKRVEYKVDYRWNCNNMSKFLESRV